MLCFPGPVQHRTKTAKLGPEARARQETVQARAQDARVNTHPYSCVPHPTPSLPHPPKPRPKANVVIVAPIGRRLAAQKGESDDIVGAMKAQERAGANDDSSDEED